MRLQRGHRPGILPPGHPVRAAQMEMLALRDAPGISEPDLMDHYLAHRADYAVPESVSFRHVFSARLFAALTRGQRPGPPWRGAGWRGVRGEQAG